MRQVRYLFVFGGTIGDGLVGAHLGRLLSANEPGTTLTVVSTRQSPFMRELLEPLEFIDFREMPKESPGSWLRLFWFLLSSWKSVVYVPLKGLPMWWRIILWFASQRAGSTVVHMTGNDALQSQQMFDTPQKVLAQWGIAVREKPRPALPFSATACVKDALPKSPYLIFHFFAGITRRSIPVMRAKEILSAAHTAFPGHTLVLTGSKGDKARAEAIVQETKAEMYIDLQPRELKCLIAAADAYVGVDTGTSHIAAHLSAPMVVLGHNNAPFWWTPPYTPHSIVLRENKNCLCLKGNTEKCYYLSAEGSVYRCLYDITPEMIVAAVEQTLAQKSTTPRV